MPGGARDAVDPGGSGLRPKSTARSHIGKYRLRARAGRYYSVLIGESNHVAIDPAIGGYGVADTYLGEFSPHYPRRRSYVLSLKIFESIYIECLSTLRCKPIYYKTLS